MEPLKKALANKALATTPGNDKDPQIESNLAALNQCLTGTARSE